MMALTFYSHIIQYNSTHQLVLFKEFLNQKKCIPRYPFQHLLESQFSPVEEALLQRMDVLEQHPHVAYKMFNLLHCNVGTIQIAMSLLQHFAVLNLRFSSPFCHIYIVPQRAPNFVEQQKVKSAYKPTPAKFLLRSRQD